MRRSPSEIALITRALFVTPELAPYVKAGGLGDVSRDLPRALSRAGADVKVLLPAYPALLEAFPDAREIARIPALGAMPDARLLAAQGDSDLLLLDSPACYARSGNNPYAGPDGVDWDDNPIRFGLLSRVAALLGGGSSPLGWIPDIVHCNDWPTGLAAAYLARDSRARAACVMTIHNLAHQGLFPQAALAQLALPGEMFALEGLEFYGQVSFLKAGLQYAQRLTTVSPTYAREIQQPEYGCGLEGLLQRRSAELSGILNGIDEQIWNPALDPLIAQRYDAAQLDKKRPNKLALQRLCGLESDGPDAQIPLLGMVARLVHQKGADLVAEIAPALAGRAQLVVLGQGEPAIERRLSALAQGSPRSVAVRLGFDESLAHLIEAGADIFVMPSRFEPCGLNQLYSLRYGTLPLVRRTGGLADSVVDAEADSGGGANGFVFDAATPEALRACVERALVAYREPQAWRELQQNAMRRDSSWVAAARAYLEVYRAAGAALRG